MEEKISKDENFDQARNESNFKDGQNKLDNEYKEEKLNENNKSQNEQILEPKRIKIPLVLCVTIFIMIVAIISIVIFRVFA